MLIYARRGDVAESLELSPLNDAECFGFSTACEQNFSSTLTSELGKERGVEEKVHHTTYSVDSLKAMHFSTGPLGKGQPSPLYHMYSVMDEATLKQVFRSKRVNPMHLP